MKTTITILTLLICLHSVAQIKPLKIGDTVPDIEFKLLNSDKKTVKLSDYKGKLVILDFWATWCGACIGGFNKADALQKEFGDKIQILLVNSSNRTKPDSRGKLDTFYTKWMQRFPEFNLPIAYEDTMAFLLFKHSGIPHYVWIGTQGEVEAITYSNSVTVENINKYLNGQKLNLAVKNGYRNDIINIDGVTPLFVSTLDNYSMFKKGELHGITPINAIDGKRERGKSFVNRIIIRNKPLLDIYKRAIEFKNYQLLDPKRWLLQTDKLIFNLNGNNDKGDKEIKDDLYTYELIVPYSESNNLYEHMIADLNCYTSFNAGIQERKVKCLVLRIINAQNKFKASGNKFGAKLKDSDSIKYIYNRELKYLIKNLDGRPGIKLPVLDETNYPGKVDMEFTYYGDDIPRLRKELQRYGLDLVEAEREVEVFVIRDKKVSGEK